ncbi:MAG: AraC family transcriptional regulator [Bifidobacteriaceae bacterium]|jgi:AraC-like DNA-binding protein|nr:AraC family transcriptional regulator [Bifidobacteriaceae bacterium]
MTRDIDNRFLGELDLTPELIELWGELPGVMFAVKDAQGRYAAVNDAFVRRSSASSRAEALGRTAAELFLPELAERYESQDAEVMASGRPLRGELEIIRAPGGQPGWYLTTKLPLVRGVPPDRAPVGVVTISTELSLLGSPPAVGRGLSMAVDAVRRALDSALGQIPSVAALAGLAGMSTSSLARNMRRVFGLAPQAYILQQRMDRAMALLAATDLPIAQVAAQTGFYDQSTFTRQLGRLTGETPAGFRRRSRSLNPPTPSAKSE